MCFFIDEKHPNKKIAKKDITCYKILSKSWNSYYRNFKYELDTIYECPSSLFIEKSGPSDIITLGFHSYSNKKEAIGVCGDRFAIIVKCIIPKGTEYYYNSKYKEYVSNKIKVIERIK